MNPEHPDRPVEEARQDARIGQGKMFVLKASATVALAEQAGRLHDALSNIVVSAGGWLVDDMVRAARAKGFVSLMEHREKGEMPWEEVCPSAVGFGTVKRPTALARKTPPAMLLALGYPCWALGKHLYSIDLFNPANELMLPYDDHESRYWAVYTYPPTFVMPDATFAAVLEAVATTVNVDYGFGGQWLAQAIYAYRFAAWSDNNYMKPLDPSVRLTDLSYPHMLLRAKDLASGVLARLQSDEFAVRRAGRPETMKTCDVLGPDGEYVFLRLGPLYPDANDDLVKRVGALIGKPYAKTMVVREAADG